MVGRDGLKGKARIDSKKAALLQEKGDESHDIHIGDGGPAGGKTW